MTFRLIGADEWVERWRFTDRPSSEDVDALRDWLSGLEVDPRQRPSERSSRPHPHHQDELRGTFLLGAGVFVAYAVDNGERVVRVLYEGPDPTLGGDPRCVVTTRSYRP